MTDETNEPTHTPLYIGMNPEDAVCQHHGEMQQREIPVIKVGERIHAALEGVTLYGCPECCIDLFAIAGEPAIDPEQALTFFWKQYLTDEWASTIEDLFVDLGPGDMDLHDGRAVVLFDEKPEAAIIPDHFESQTDWFVRGRSKAESTVS